MNTRTDNTNATDNGKTALETLLAAMDAGGDFPALSRTITEINQAVGDENSRASKITEIILREKASGHRIAAQQPTTAPLRIVWN